jgi:hypothetical protein
MSVAQDSNSVSLWFKTSRRELGYVRTSADKFSSGKPALLLPEGSTSSFSACVTTPDPLNGNVTRQMLISNDSGGHLSLLEQSSDLGLWRSTPFYAPSSTKSTPVQSYTVTVKAKNKSGQAANNASLFVSASSTVSALLNGTNILLTKEPAWLECDTQGSLDFIIPTNSLSSQVITVEAMRSSNGQRLDFARKSFDPTAKVMAKMVSKVQHLASGQDLLSAKTDSGENLIPANAQVDLKDLDEARKHLLEVGRAYQTLDATSDKPVLHSRAPAQPMVAMAVHQPEDLGDLLMDGWTWVKEKASEAVEWGVKQAGKSTRPYRRALTDESCRQGVGIRMHHSRRGEEIHS